MLAEYDGTVWVYHLNDGLGSVRQLADNSGDVTLAQGYTPFGVPLWSEGNATTGYGFTGERWEAYSALLFLRARYYEPGTGRFVQRDQWEGDYHQPQTLLRSYLYVLNNPVNVVDPTGRYHRYVHYDLTRSWALGLAQVYGVPNAEKFANHIAEGNWHVDESKILNSVTCGHCHFCAYAPTVSNVLEAIESCNPFLFGASLHQMQDWWSHWGEGYKRSHVLDSARAGVKPGQESSRPVGLIDDFFKGGHWEVVASPDEDSPLEEWVTSPYPAHPKDMIEKEIWRRNPGIDLSSLSDDDLIDLYLRSDPHYWDSNWRQRIEERGHFGLDPDKYIERSWRDGEMGDFTRYLIGRFMRHITTNCCEIDWEKPGDVKIWTFLRE